MNTVLAAAAALLSLLMQTTLAPRFTLAGGRVDFLASTLCLLCCLTPPSPHPSQKTADRGFLTALSAGAASGLILDLLFGRDGLYILQYLLPSFLYFFLSIQRPPKDFLAGAVFAFLACALKDVFPFLSLYFQRVEMNAGGMLLQTLIGAAFSCLWFCLLYFPLQKAFSLLDGLFTTSESAQLLAAKRDAALSTAQPLRRHKRL